MNIVVSNRSWAKRHKREFSAVLTIEDPDQRYGIRFTRQPAPDHLVLQFVDLDYPAPGPLGVAPIFRTASQDDLRRALDFARNRPDLLIQCNVGVGRSPAVALAILAEAFGPGRELDALDELVRIRPEAVPNLRVVLIADHLLGRRGKLYTAVREWDRQRSGNLERRRLNHEAHFSYYGYSDVPPWSETDLTQALVYYLQSARPV